MKDQKLEATVDKLETETLAVLEVYTFQINPIREPNPDFYKPRKTQPLGETSRKSVGSFVYNSGSVIIE